MLLGLYLGTTAFSWATIILYTKIFSDRLKKEGYEYKKSDKTIYEKVATSLSFVLKMSIPIINISLALVAIFNNIDKLYTEFKNNLLKDGDIELKTSLEQKEFDNTEIFVDADKIYSETIDKPNVGKNYSEMTMEEKIKFLESERELLLQQDKVQVNDKPKTRKREKNNS